MSTLTLRAAPASGRWATITETLARLNAFTGGGPARIAEAGIIRGIQPAVCYADGWSTRIWAWYISQTGGEVHAIDPDPRAHRATKDILGKRRRLVTFHAAVAQDVLPDILPLDLLYMDGPPEAETHLAIWRSIAHCPPRLVLFDDILDPVTFAVKGELAIPAMLEAGYRLRFVCSRQALLEYGEDN